MGDEIEEAGIKNVRLVAQPESRAFVPKAVGVKVMVRRNSGDAFALLKRLGLDPEKPMVVAGFVAGYGKKTVMVKHPGRDEPVMMWGKYLELDRTETLAKRKAIRERREAAAETKP